MQKKNTKPTSPSWPLNNYSYSA